MFSLKKYMNEFFGTLTVFIEGNMFLFYGIEVATILGYEAPRNAVRNFVDSSDKIVLKYSNYKACTDSVQAAVKEQLWKGADFSDKTLITEPGLYALIFGSKLDSAIPFKNWVTHEVLPSIRRTDAYISDEAIEKLQKSRDAYKKDADDAYNMYDVLLTDYLALKEENNLLKGKAETKKVSIEVKAQADTVITVDANGLIILSTMRHFLGQ